MDETKAKKLEQLARALNDVAPGPWEIVRGVFDVVRSACGAQVATAQPRAAMLYIVALSPDVVLDLLGEREVLKADNAALTYHLTGVVNVQPGHQTMKGRKPHEDAVEALRQAHPGAELLQELQEERETRVLLQSVLNETAEHLGVLVGDSNTKAPKLAREQAAELRRLRAGMEWTRAYLQRIGDVAAQVTLDGILAPKAHAG